ncbi:MAG: PQQ-binding-like beta-propeller repeat protein [Clostridiales bacterium]|nr:PQQ-binding-like beta-propeller repeat protein [Clostridiales bacterium]
MAKVFIKLLRLVMALIIAIGTGAWGGLQDLSLYKGAVYDENSGAPMANVLVSDGRNVVKTDADGSFALKGWAKTRFITVTVPSGYTTDEFYIPAKLGVKEYNFTLRERPISPDGAHDFLAIADSEIGAGGVGDWIHHVKGWVDEIEPAFLIHLGDICYEDGLKQHIKDMNSQNMGVPVHYIMGNHDYVAGLYGEELFESIYGPVWYSFDVGNIHYVITPFQTGADYLPGYAETDRWKWLENDLKHMDPGKQLVIFNHRDAYIPDYVFSTGLLGKKLDLKEHNLAAWFFGHNHTNFVNDNNGIINICTARPDCGGIDQSLSGTRHVNFDADGKMTSVLRYYEFEEKTAAPEGGHWSTDLGQHIAFADPLLVGDRLYVGTMDDSYPMVCGLHALDANDGSLLWYYETENSVINKPVYDSGMVIAQDSAGNVYGLNAASGKLAWQKKLIDWPSQNTMSGIIAEKGVVYAGSPGHVFALNVNTGEKLWDNNVSRGEASASEFVIAGDTLVVGVHWGALVGINKNTGKKLWENRDGHIRFRSSTPALIDANTLLVADSNAVMIVDVVRGEITSKTVLEGYTLSSSGQPAIDGKAAYIPTANKGLIAFDLESKTILWNKNTRPARIFTAPYVGKGAQTVESSPILYEGKLYFGASDGYAYVLDPATGNSLEEIHLAAPVLNNLIPGADGIIVADFSGRVTKVGV